MKCPYCGAENPDGAKICVKCASWMEVPPQQPAQPSQPAPAQVQQAPQPMQQPPVATAARPRSPMMVPIVLIVVILIIGVAVIAAVVLSSNAPQGPHLEITNALHSTSPKDASSTYLVFTVTVKNIGTEAGSATLSCNATYGTYMTGGGIAFSSNTQAVTQVITLDSGAETTVILKIAIASNYLTTGHFVKYYERLG